MKLNTLALTVGAAAAILAAGTGAAVALNSHDDAAVSIGFDGSFKPDNDITVTATCPGDRAHLHTTLGDDIDMVRTGGVLSTVVHAPVNIGPGPDDGYHQATVTCDDGSHTTVRFPNDGNGQH